MNALAADKDISFMRLALEEAEAAYRSGEVPVGAVIVDAEGMVLARAHNLCEQLQDATAHAEMLAIRKASNLLGNWRLSALTLYVTLEPCPMCAGAIVMSRLGRLVYGGMDAKAGACESLFNVTSHPAVSHQPQITAGVLESECIDILKRFFKEQR